MRALRGLFLCACVITTALAQIQVTPLVEFEGETSEPSLSPDGKTLLFDWCKPDYSCSIYERALAGGDVREVAGKDDKEGWPLAARWSPDGKRISFARFYSHYDSHLFIRDFSGGAERDLGLVCGFENNWSPDGRFLPVSEYVKNTSASLDCRVALFSSETGVRVARLTAHEGAAAFSPDGRRMAFADGKALMLLELTGEYRPKNAALTITREQNEITDVSWTPDGKRIVYGVSGDVPYLRRIAVSPYARPQTIPGLDSLLSITQLLADGSALATETTRLEALWRVDLTLAHPKLEMVADPGCFDGVPGCSPDGKSRAFLTKRTGVWQVWLANADGTNERRLVSAIPAFLNPADDGVPSIAGWSPDGKWIAVTVFPAHGNADTRTRLYVVSSAGGSMRRLGSQIYALDGPAWSPDSKSLYAIQGWSTEDRTHDLESPIVRVDLADGKISPLGADGMWPHVSVDGKFVYFFTSPRPKLSRIPIGGGTAERMWDKEDLSWLSVGPTARDLYLFQRLPREVAGADGTIIRFDPESRRAAPLVEIPFRPRFAFTSPDRRFLYLEQQGEAKRRVVLVHGLF